MGSVSSVTGRPLSATFLFSPQSGNQSEREMKKGNLGCLLLLLRACYASPTGALLQEGHPLLDRDTFLNDIGGFVLPTNPFIKSSPCPHMFCQRPSLKNPGTNICCP